MHPTQETGHKKQNAGNDRGFKSKKLADHPQPTPYARFFLFGGGSDYDVTFVETVGIDRLWLFRRRRGERQRRDLCFFLFQRWWRKRRRGFIHHRLIGAAPREHGFFGVDGRR